MRTAKITRKTGETDIELSLNLDEASRGVINSGNGFLDHMLDLFQVHGGFRLDLTCKGDTNVDILFKSRHCLFEHCLLGMNVLFLRQVANGDIIRHHHVAVRWLFETGDDANKRGFSGTVLSDKTDSVLFTNQEIDVGEEVLTGEMYAQILYRNHCTTTFLSTELPFVEMTFMK